MIFYFSWLKSTFCTFSEEQAVFNPVLKAASGSVENNNMSTTRREWTINDDNVTSMAEHILRLTDELLIERASAFHIRWTETVKSILKTSFRTDTKVTAKQKLFGAANRIQLHMKCPNYCDERDFHLNSVTTVDRYWLSWDDFALVRKITETVGIYSCWEYIPRILNGHP
jgi:hypothetical protein